MNQNIENIYNKIVNKIFQNKTLVQNFSSLSILQVFSMVFPLITYTYLIRILKSDTYGLIVFAQTVVQYFIIFINYGFNISATQSIALNRDDKNKISEIISAVFIIKVLIMVFSFIVMFVLISTVPLFKKEATLFLFSMALCVQEAIFPIWYFLGIEKMKYITIINVLSKVVFTVLIFILVTQQSDYILVPILNGIGALLAGTYSLYIVFKEKDIVFSYQPKRILSEYFKDSTYFFISNISGMIYTNAGKFILGATGNMSEVAFYDLGDKILGLLKNFTSIVEQTIFAKISVTRDLKLFNQIKNYTLLIITIICIIVFIMAKDIVYILGGNAMITASISLSILIIVAIPNVLSTFWGHILLLAWNRKSDFLKLRIISLFSFLVIIYLTSLFTTLNSKTLSYVILLNELLLVFYTFQLSKKIIYSQKNNFIKFLFKRLKFK
jgi:O-antigen/teichoic acid export membrane protein